MVSILHLPRVRGEVFEGALHAPCLPLNGKAVTPGRGGTASWTQPAKGAHDAHRFVPGPPRGPTIPTSVISGKGAEP